jgi:YHS domain-containing protein
MTWTRIGLAALLGFVMSAAAPAADAPAKRSARAALKPFNTLIGSWRGTGTPEGTREEKQKGFWTESLTWTWQFKGDDAWLTVDFEKGKYFSKGELRYLADKDAYELTLTTPDKESLAFVGPLHDGRLTLTRADDKKKETQQLVVTLLHANRFLYRYEVRPEGKTAFARRYEVGCTKEGVDFASGDGQPECIVSGGLGKIKVTYKDQTFYVCCSGCAAAFKDDPEKYIKEFEAKKNKK